MKNACFWEVADRDVAHQGIGKGQVLVPHSESHLPLHEITTSINISEFTLIANALYLMEVSPSRGHLDE